MANYLNNAIYLLHIQMGTNRIVWTIQLETMVKSLVTMSFGYQTFNHLNSKLLVGYSRHGLNNGPFDVQAVLDHLY